MRNDETFEPHLIYAPTSCLRWLRRDGDLVLQQQYSAIPPAEINRRDYVFCMSQHLHAWRDVPIVEESENDIEINPECQERIAEIVKRDYVWLVEDVE